MKAIGLVVLSVVIAVAVAYPAKQDYPLKLQPELDAVNIDEYLRNERLVDLQLRCILDKAPCDTVGRWLKPRVGAALSGTCLECTEKQKLAMNKVLSYVQEKRPEAYKESVIKYLKDAGIAVPPQDPTSSTTSTEKSS